MTGHTLIIGKSGSGKSTLAKHLVRAYIKKKMPVLVLDQELTARDWKGMGAEVYVKRDLFLEAIKQKQSAFIVIDESGSTIEKDDSANWLTTTARHFGHTTVIIAHRPTQLQTVLRENCDRLFLFQSSLSTRESISDEWGLDEPVGNLPTYYFYMLTHGKKPRKGKVTKTDIIFLEPSVDLVESADSVE